MTTFKQVFESTDVVPSIMRKKKSLDFVHAGLTGLGLSHHNGDSYSGQAPTRSVFNVLRKNGFERDYSGWDENDRGQYGRGGGGGTWTNPETGDYVIHSRDDSQPPLHDIKIRKRGESE